MKKVVLAFQCEVCRSKVLPDWLEDQTFSSELVSGQLVHLLVKTCIKNFCHNLFRLKVV